MVHYEGAYHAEQAPDEVRRLQKHLEILNSELMKYFLLHLKEANAIRVKMNSIEHGGSRRTVWR